MRILVAIFTAVLILTGCVTTHDGHKKSVAGSVALGVVMGIVLLPVVILDPCAGDSCDTNERKARDLKNLQASCAALHASDLTPGANSPLNPDTTNLRQKCISNNL